ncbi:MAG: ABC transporter permease [Bryobacterales bacterium]|nr:ABC transporter permease [Bryobacterales bacterium]
MSQLTADLRYALRSLRRTPGFSAVAILTLALGVGANTAVFSLLNAVLLRPLPYEQPERLALVWESAPFFNLHDSPVAPANYEDWRTRSRSFEEMGALEDRRYRLAGEGTPEVVQGSLATASFFRALRTRPALGRIFQEEDDQPGAAKVLLISDGFWRRRFNADPNVIGRTLRLDDERHTIVGVLAPGTEPPSEYSGEIGELWSPLRSAYTAKELANRGRHNWMVAARLRAGVPLTRANAEMQAIGESLSREYPDTNEKVGAFVAPMREHFVRSSRATLLVLFGTVVCILLIACANLANLLLTRAANRSKEVAVRAALGAGVWQLARQFLLESLVLCTFGSVVGLLLGTTTFRLLAHLAPGDVAGFKSLDVDWRVMAFTLGLAMLTAVIFGLAPMVQARRLDVGHSLKQSARTLAAAAGGSKLRAAMICSQVALAAVLLIGAGLLIRTLASLRGVDVGFRTTNVLTMNLPAVRGQMDAARSIAFQREVVRRVRELPGVRSAGFINHIPLVVKADITGLGAEGHDASERFLSNSRVIGPGTCRRWASRCGAAETSTSAMWMGRRWLS